MRARHALAFLLAAASFAAAAPAAHAKLRFTRDDGALIPFSAKPKVYCGAWDQEVHRRAIHIVVRGHRRHWELAAVRRDVKVGRRMRFPNEFVFNRPHGVELFVADAPNEASTNEEEASGSMTFTHATCRHGGIVSFSIDAVLGSEFSDLGTVKVTGTFHAQVSNPPGGSS